jgi:formyl-CoA transferase
MNSQSLSDVKVLEIGEFIAAPYCGKLLADLGANVVKVECPEGGDRARGRGPFPPKTTN